MEFASSHFSHIIDTRFGIVGGLFLSSSDEALHASDSLSRLMNIIMRIEMATLMWIFGLARKRDFRFHFSTEVDKFAFHRRENLMEILFFIITRLSRLLEDFLSRGRKQEFDFGKLFSAHPDRKVNKLA